MREFNLLIDRHREEFKVRAKLAGCELEEQAPPMPANSGHTADMLAAWFKSMQAAGEGKTIMLPENERPR